VKHRLLASLAFGVLLAGCGSSSGSGAPDAAITQSTRTLLERIPDAPMNVAYSGTRHVSLHYAQDGVPNVLDYDENVASDGHGHFSIVPGQVTAPPMTDAQRQFFAILQERRDGFFYRYRDFRIRDWRTFLQNWRVVDTGSHEVVAGRSTDVLEVRRNEGTSTEGARVWYRAWIDPETALVLRADEFDASNRLVSHTEFLTFTLTPDLSGLALHGDRNPGAPFDPSADTTASLGFRVLVPTILPEGYRLERAESLSVGNAGEDSGTWARLGFGDGVDELFFLQTVAGEDQAQIAGHPGSGSIGPDAGPRSVRVFQVGLWTVVQGQFQGVRAVVMGKTDVPSLLRMLKSAVH
jgi:MucB/RseB N-terminal domain